MTSALVYTRAHNPTRARAEVVLGSLEGGSATLFSSGLAAVQAMLYLLTPKTLVCCDGYGGTRSAMELYAKQTGMKMILNNLDDSSTALNDPKWWEEKIHEGDVIYLETPRNPLCLLQDIKKISTLAHERKAKVVVDSTFATPLLQKPLSLGADVVLHSCTKFLGGHSDLLAGALIVKDQILTWRLNSIKISIGAMPGNLESYLLLRSLRTIGLRIPRQSKSALKIAKFLAKHERVEKVFHPWIVAKQLADKGSNDMMELLHSQMFAPYSPPCFSFQLKKGFDASQLSSYLLLFVDATSLGGVESTIEWTHRFHSDYSDRLLRMSTGIEDPKDLIADLKQALAAL
eukprot:TRINITY_DN8052_c0_g1_i1.p1 TRINITY_DN8052_c0_g1~~TRINITY_DN8052_c0_g1_i1.p1  ORF type:complete len:345 (-),score=68.39 TRINITY_DN8052_c0_g1_i1:70-1104(-)